MVTRDLLGRKEGNSNLDFGNTVSYPMLDK